ncbi:hypothetical protein JCM19274_659 [Algibacter lectus]|uniref:Uncharacterized protein n=1 Tax=Algibacter lectus TaxID=221126 RepID=A0A090WY68_9FLAO|nr:hypothetical protein JCM19274_659 [Algibacter lectus]
MGFLGSTSAFSDLQDVKTVLPKVKASTKYFDAFFNFINFYNCFYLSQ